VDQQTEFLSTRTETINTMQPQPLATRDTSPFKPSPGQTNTTPDTANADWHSILRKRTLKGTVINPDTGIKQDATVEDWSVPNWLYAAIIICVAALIIGCIMPTTVFGIIGKVFAAASALFKTIQSWWQVP
jgi:hypothetical protein